MIPYFERLVNDIPQYVYEGLLAVLCIGAVSLLVCKGINSARGISKMLLIEYIFIVYCMTVIFREDNEDRKFDFTPFWSYGRPDLLTENIMNIIVFLPVGLLLGFAIKCMTWWKVLLIGGGISLSIETLQFVLRRGFSEVDDVMHNTLGCMIGYGLYSFVIYLYDNIYMKRFLKSV